MGNMIILESFTDAWNFTFLIAASIAVLIGSILTIRNMKKEEYEKRREKRNKDDLDNTITIDTLVKKNKNSNSEDINSKE